MKLLDRYVIRELGVPFGIGIAVAVALLIGTLLFNNASDFISRGIPILLVAKLVLSRAPQFSVIAMPMAMGFATSLAINRLARDTEMTPIRMAGIPFWRIIRPLAAVGLAASVGSYVLASLISPWANEKANQIVRQIWMQSVVPVAQPNVFLHAEMPGTMGGYTFYIGSLQRTRKDMFLLRDVLVYDTRRQGYPVWYAAPEATTTRRFWTLQRVVRRDIGKDGLTVNETYLPELNIDLENDVDFLSGAQTPEEMTGDQLMDQIRMLTKTGSRNVARSYVVQLHSRFALPLACLILAVLSAPLSLRFSRGGTFVGILVSIVIGFLYWNTMILTKILGENGVLPPVLAAWSMNILFGAVAAVLVWKTG